MDTFTHGVLGLAVGWAATRPNRQETASDPSGAVAAQTARALPWLTVLAAEAPDFDVVIRRLPGLAWVGHRGITHTLVAHLCAGGARSGASGQPWAPSPGSGSTWATEA